MCKFQVLLGRLERTRENDLSHPRDWTKQESCEPLPPLALHGKRHTLHLGNDLKMFSGTVVCCSDNPFNTGRLILRFHNSKTRRNRDDQMRQCQRGDMASAYARITLFTNIGRPSEWLGRQFPSSIAECRVQSYTDTVRFLAFCGSRFRL